jgi:deazaflavin-dependent oxidoreductase (nitroreductase family)
MSGDRKRRLVVAFEKYLQNPPVKAALRAGVPLPMFALLETIGRTSGIRRQTPVINGRHGGRFWIVAEHGRQAQYVRNLEADPNVRVKAVADGTRDARTSSTTMTHWPERGGWPTPSGRCTRPTASPPVCSAPNRIDLEPFGTGYPAKPDRAGADHGHRPSTSGGTA